LKFLYDAGIGAKNSQGFGMFESVEWPNFKSNPKHDRVRDVWKSEVKGLMVSRVKNLFMGGVAGGVREMAPWN
jgi:hypothetical protein